jgi:crotonobetainyl-CoA:carnitine CoA-transferase CaiB-like acyl-CoA transferase
MMANKVLNGVRIIDLTMVYAGPVATKMMAELGAEVIKIESAQRADIFTRANVYPDNRPGNEPWNQGSFFHTLNQGKRGISLNLCSEEGRLIFKRLVNISDVVIENYSPRVMDNWGLNYEELQKINPRIIMVSISGLGHYGPLKNYSMYVPGMEGMSGLTYITGDPCEPPLLSGNAYGDWVTGANAAMALVTALFYQKATGKGQYLDVSGREATTCHIGEALMEYSFNNQVRERTGNRHPLCAPHGCYRCQGDDEWIAIGVENEKQWRHLQYIVDTPSINDRMFDSMASRLQNQEELDRIIEEWTIDKDKFILMDTLQKAQVPAGAILNMKEINLNPQLAKRGFFKLVDHDPETGLRPIPKQMPAIYQGFKSFPIKRAPGFSEDTAYVLGDLLKMTKFEIEQLEANNVISSQPIFPSGKPTRLNLIEKQQSGWTDPDYLNQLNQHYDRELGPVAPDQ